MTMQNYYTPGSAGMGAGGVNEEFKAERQQLSVAFQKVYDIINAMGISLSQGETIIAANGDIVFKINGDEKFRVSQSIKVTGHADFGGTNGEPPGPAGDGRIIFDGQDKKFKVSEDGGPYKTIADIAGGGGGGGGGGGSIVASRTFNPGDSGAFYFDVAGITPVSCLTNTNNVGSGEDSAVLVSIFDLPSPAIKVSRNPGELSEDSISFIITGFSDGRVNGIIQSSDLGNKAAGSINITYNPNRQTQSAPYHLIMDGDTVTIGDGVLTKVFEFDMNARATGKILCPSGSLIQNGETVTISDGNQSKVFTFSKAGYGYGGSGVISITDYYAPYQVAYAFMLAVQSSGLNLSASVSGGMDGYCHFCHNSYGVKNLPITDTVANAGFVPTGISGGSSQGSVIPGRIAVLGTDTSPTSTIASALGSAISSSGLNIELIGAGQGGGLSLKNKTAGILGNVPILKTGIGMTTMGMYLGVDATPIDASLIAFA